MFNFKLMAGGLIFVTAILIGQQTISNPQIRNPTQGIPGPQGPQGIQGIPGPPGPPGTNPPITVQVTSLRGILLNKAQSPNVWTLVNTFAVPVGVVGDATFTVYYNGLYQNINSCTIVYDQPSNNWIFTFNNLPFSVGDGAEVRYIQTSVQ